MPSWIVPSDTHVPNDTGHTTDHDHVADDLTLINNALPVVSGGLTGATAALRLAGAIASGVVPASGTFAVGDVVIVQTGAIIVCTVAGTPGTWVQVGSVLYTAIVPAVVTLTFVASGTTLVNAASGNDFRLTVTASTTTIGNPSNSVDGERIDFQITQGAGGSFTVAWGTSYDFGAAGAPTLTTTAGKVDVIGFVYNAALGKWIYLGAALGN